MEVFNVGDKVIGDQLSGSERNVVTGVKLDKTGMMMYRVGTYGWRDAEYTNKWWTKVTEPAKPVEPKYKVGMRLVGKLSGSMYEIMAHSVVIDRYLMHHPATDTSVWYSAEKLDELFNILDEPVKQTLPKPEFEVGTEFISIITQNIYRITSYKLNDKCDGYVYLLDGNWWYTADEMDEMAEWLKPVKPKEPVDGGWGDYISAATFVLSEFWDHEPILATIIHSAAAKMKTLPSQRKANELVRLGDCPPGLFVYDGTICLKCDGKYPAIYNSNGAPFMLYAYRTRDNVMVEPVTLEEYGGYRQGFDEGWAVGVKDSQTGKAFDAGYEQGLEVGKAELQDAVNRAYNNGHKQGWNERKAHDFASAYGGGSFSGLDAVIAKGMK